MRRPLPKTEATVDLLANVGFNLRRIRRKRGLSREDLVERTGLAIRTIENAERGGDLYLSTALRLAHAMDTVPSELFHRPADFVVEIPTFHE